MRTPPTDDHDRKYLDALNVEPWMVELLDLNPSYVFWGPHEDCMWNKSDGWNSPCLIDDWESCGFKLDELNEVVNYYFELNRESEECSSCHGNGYHPDAQTVVNGFYDLEGCGNAWHDKVTQDEVDALWASERLKHDFKEKPSADQVNEWERARGFGHDGINRMIMIETRLKRLGLPKTCPQCNGDGSVFTAECGHVSLVLWVIHPRKGASRGVEIKRVEQDDLPKIYAYLSEAAERNAKRFQAVAGVVSEAIEGGE